MRIFGSDRRWHLHGAASVKESQARRAFQYWMRKFGLGEAQRRQKARTGRRK